LNLESAINWYLALKRKILAVAETALSKPNNSRLILILPSQQNACPLIGCNILAAMGNLCHWEKIAFMSKDGNPWPCS